MTKEGTKKITNKNIEVEWYQKKPKKLKWSKQKEKKEIEKTFER